MNLENLQGLITPELGEELRQLAMLVDPRLAIVELGSFKGMSTCYLAQGAMEGAGAFVWAVDPWDLPGNVYGKHGFTDPSVREAFAAQLEKAGLILRVIPIRGFSHDVGHNWTALDNCGSPVGLLYIDADHSFASVWRDFSSWKKHLVKGATVAFDDYGTQRNPGVKTAVDKLVALGELDRFRLVAERLAVCRYPHARPIV